jgi:GrpB-like predicted nucleotidyltransferase (UPF0157 family)
MEIRGQLFGVPLRDAVEIAPYDPAWPARFEAHRRALAAALGDAPLRIDHIGSTAVPGLASKPVIDIQVSVRDVDRDEVRYRPALEALGLELRYREPEWAYFRTMTPPRTHHVHVTPAGSARERAQLLFVAYLRADPRRRDEYGALKAALATALRNDRLAYTEAKTEFIAATLTLAEAWAAETGWWRPAAAAEVSR